MSLNIITTTITPKKEISILNVNIDEMRRTFDHISNIYDQLRIKALAFVAGEIAIVTFLFATSVPFPHLLYGQILFISSVIALLLASGLLFWTITTIPWKIPCDFVDHKQTLERYKDELSMTRYVHDEYVRVLEYCVPVVSKKAKRFNLTIYLLSAGVIIVLLIKYGGPHL